MAEAKADSVGSIGLDLVVNKNGFDREMNSIQGLAIKAGKALAGAFATKKLIDFGKKCLELGSDLNEVQNVVDVTFTSMSDKVDEFAQNAIADFGMSETLAKKFTGTFGAMAKSFGFSEKQAYDMSTSLTQLAGDVASFYNMTQDQAYTKLKSVFTGESESLKELGVVMTQSSLDAYAMANGFGKTTAKMSEGEKVALRYQFVMDQLSAAQGDFSRTSGSWANQVRILTLQFDSLKATIGQGLINLFTPIIRVINMLVGKLFVLANAFKSFTEMITGKKSGAAGVSSLGDAAAKTGEELGGASDSANNLGSAAKKAGNAAKKAAKQMAALMGFDVMNKLPDQQDEDSGAGSAGDAGAAGGVGGIDFGSLEKGETVMDEVDKRFDSIIKKGKQLARIFKKGFKIGFGDSQKRLDEIEGHLQGIKDSFKAIFTDGDLLKAANQMLDSMALSAGKKAGAMVSIGTTIADGLVGSFDQYLRQSKGFITKSLTDIFEQRAETERIVGNFYTALADVFSVFAGKNSKTIGASLIGMFTDAYLGAKDLGTRIGRDILDALTAPFIQNKDAIKQAIDGTLQPIAKSMELIWNTVKAFAERALRVYDEHIKPLFDSLRDGLTEIAAAVLEWYNTYIVPVLDELQKKFEQVWKEHVIPLLYNFQDLIGSVGDMLKSLWENIIVPFIEWFVKNVAPVIAPILRQLGRLFLNLIATVSDVFSGIIDILKGATEFLSGVFAGDWETAFHGMDEIVKGFKKIIDSVFGFIKKNIMEPFDKFLTGIFETDWTKSFGSFGETLNGFCKTAEDVYDDVKGFFNLLLKFIKTLFTDGWTAAWQGVGGIFAGIFESLVDTAKKPINAVIDLVNGMLAQINAVLAKVESAFSFSIDLKNPFTGNSIYTKSTSLRLPRVPQIPRLAEGGYVKPNTPQLAMIGDNRHQGEVVSPENKLMEMAYKAAMMASGSGGSAEMLELLREIIKLLKDMDIVRLDPEEIRKYFVKKTNQNTKATGKCEIVT